MSGTVLGSKKITLNAKPTACSLVVKYVYNANTLSHDMNVRCGV